MWVRPGDFQGATATGPRGKHEEDRVLFLSRSGLPDPVPACPRFTGPIDDAHRGLVKGLAARIEEQQEPGPPEGIDVHQVVLRALADIPADRWQPAVTDERIRRAMLLIQGHLRQPMSNTDLGRAVGLHPQSFVRLFRKEAGIPPPHYALQLRVDRACEQRLHENVSVEAVAENWGFSDRFHLTRALAKHRSTTPGRLRKRVV